MKTHRLGLAACLSLIAGSYPASAASLFMGSYPDKLVVFDEDKGAVTQTITLKSGLPTSMVMSQDRKRLYVTTITTSGIEVIDTATRRVVNSFSLNTPTTRYRFGGGVADPSGRYFYTMVKRFDKEVDRWKVADPQFAVIDLQKQQIAKTFPIAREDKELANSWRMGYRISGDGKLLYVFRDKVLVLNTSDFSVVERIDLEKPRDLGMEEIGFGGDLDSLQQPGQFVSLFNAVDPYVRTKLFGVARFDLATRAFDFTPIGPAPDAMAGLEVTPDGKEAYTVVTTGQYGNKRCEFWRFDMATTKVLDKKEFHCRSRFRLGMSSDGAKLYIYGASYDIEVYDAKTLTYEKTWDVMHDTTGAGMAIVP